MLSARRVHPLLIVLLACVIAAPRALASQHGDPVVPLLLALTVVLVSAKIGGWIATRIHQPAVLGELVAGILIGNLGLVGFRGFEPFQTDTTLSILAGLGVILLLFEVGLDSTVLEMMQVGASALLVALLGVVTPFALGWLVGAWLLPDRPSYVHAFLGAVLTATSVGITARVLRDLDASRTSEAKIILGAAVIDDVLGLVILAVVSGVIAAAGQGTGVSLTAIAWVCAKAIGFLAGAILLGRLLAPWLFRIAALVRVRGILLTTGLIFCFLLSYLAALADLAPIVGAFAAGLVLEGSHLERFEEAKETTLESLLHPISTFLVPIFFVMTGMRVSLETFADPAVIGLAAAITVIAWVGKQACSLGVLQRGVDRLTVGLGMVPRGEVGLIFATMGATLTLAGQPVIGPATYSAIVIMVIVTTLVTPPALKWSIERQRRRAA
ncbi:MAG TPA: cation:proton antiporter [Candidatus Eisenbacteria bacterium]|nr:cation:proton antiporter [Candidatus Eisenbacteria bacterium]